MEDAGRLSTGFKNDHRILLGFVHGDCKFSTLDRVPWMNVLVQWLIQADCGSAPTSPLVETGFHASR